MPRNGSSRRSFLKGVGAAVAAGAVGVGASSPAAAASEGFTRVESATQKSIRAVAQTAEGPYGAANNGDIVTRRMGGWEQSFEKILDAGIEAQGKSFYGADATGDGRNCWVVGESGVAGHYDVVDEEFTDYSRPAGVANTWQDVVATGPAGSEDVMLVDGSGNFVSGRKDDDAMTWDDPVTVGGGNTLSALVGHGGDDLWIADSTGMVRRSTDGGATWTAIGPDAPVPFYDLAAPGADDLIAVGGSGYVYEYDGSRWTETKVASSSIRAVDARGGRVVAAGAGGTIYRRIDSGWEATNFDSSKTLRTVALDGSGSFPDVVAGNQGDVFEQGSFDASPDTLRVESAASTTTEYGVGISNRTRKAALADAGDSVEETCGCAGSTFQIDGSVGAGDDADSYDYGGDIDSFTVDAGTAADLTTYVSGTEVSVERLTDRAWTEVESGVTDTLFDVVESATGLYAVGGSGKVIGRDAGEWAVVTSNGPTGGGNNLYGAATTDGGATVWMAGGSGVLGRMDAETETIEDLTAPNDKTTGWTDIGVAGPAGSERVLLTNGAGEVLRGTNDDGTMTWEPAVKPGSGSTIRGVTSLSAEEWYLCDDNATVYRSTDGGATWSSIGIDGAGVTLYDIDAVTAEDITVVGGSGRTYRYNGEVWTTRKLCGNSRYSVAREQDRGLLAGGSGQLFEKELQGWELANEETSVNLQGTLITDDPDVPKVVVGGNGVVIEQSFVDPLY
jgi:hypothetical protein